MKDNASSKKKTQIKTSTFILLAILIALIVFFVYFVYYFTTSADVTHDYLGCEGIENFYTGNGFWSDKQHILSSARTNSMAYPPMKPISISQGKNVDCDTISNAVMCLAELYNENCHFYMAVYNNLDNTQYNVFGFIGHMGISCYHKNIGKWVQVY